MAKVSLLDLTKPRGVSVLLYGRTGTGKTRLLTTHKDILILGTEGKPLTVALQTWREANNVEYAKAESVDAIIAGARYCVREKLACGLDSISLWQSNIQIPMVEESTNKKLEFDQWNDIKIETLKALKHIANMKDRNLDVIVTAHVTDRVPQHLQAEYRAKVARATDSRTRDRLYGQHVVLMAHLDGQMRDRLHHWFDAVGYMEQKKGKYTINFQCDYAEVKDSEGRLGIIEIDKDDSLALQRICDTIRSA